MYLQKPLEIEDKINYNICNIWNSIPYNRRIAVDYIKRHIEELIKETNKTFKSTLVTGARQVGKTEIIKHLFSNEYKIVTFDDPFIEDQAKQNPETFLVFNKPPAFLDEVQRVGTLFRYIKMILDNSNKKGQYIFSGSQPLELMKNASESLSGRVGIIEMSCLSLREIQNISFNLPFVPTFEYLTQRSKFERIPTNIWDIIHRGGYPEIQDKTINWNTFYSSYVKTYLERDVRELINVQDLDTFRRFMVCVAARTGQVLNYSNIARECGKDSKTIKSWMSILETTGIVYLLEPYNSSALNRVIKSPKIYFRDTGLAAYLTRWLSSETLASGAMSGAFFETFVVSEILKSYSNIGIDYRYCVSYYRGSDKKKKTNQGITTYEDCEIDLIIEQDGILYPIEIKQNNSVSVDMTNAFVVLDQIPDKKRGTGAIICTCPMPGNIRENIYQIPVWYI